MIPTFPVSSVSSHALLAAPTASSAADSGPGWETVAIAAMLGLAAGVALGFVASRFLANRSSRDAPGPSHRRPRSWQKSSPDVDTTPSNAESPRRPRAWESAGLANLPAHPADPDLDPPADNPADEMNDETPSPSRRREEI